MTRTVVLAAALVGALSFGHPQLAAAQDPEPPQPPPRGAVRRAPATDTEGRHRREPRTPPETRVGAVPAAESPSAAADDGQRRGAVRRPPSGDASRGDSPRSGSAAVDRAVPRSSAPRPPERVFVF